MSLHLQRVFRLKHHQGLFLGFLGFFLLQLLLLFRHVNDHTNKDNFFYGIVCTATIAQGPCSEV